MTFKRYITLTVFVFAALATVNHAQNNGKKAKKENKASKKNKKPKKKTGSARSKALTPEEQLKTFTVPKGFVVELVASEENGLVNPIDLAFDPSGQLWTGTARMYPLDPIGAVGKKMIEQFIDGKIKESPAFKKNRSLYQRKTKGTDKILIIEDPTKQVRGTIPVFAEGMTIPQSFIPYKGGVYVAHGSEMLYLHDKNKDGKEDGQDTILTGFGFTDSHTMSHTLVRGPGKWIHFSHGALNAGKVTVVKSGNTSEINFSKIARFSLDGEHLEVVNNGLQNIWGFNLKANGQWYGTEANDLFMSLVPLHPYMGYKGIGNDRLKPYQPFINEFHDFKVEGTGISGLAYDENGSKGFPKEWKNAGFLANPITSKINAVIADRKPDGSVISKHLPDFLECSDDWFRPVNIEFGPDGCLYIVDWYNKIVSHNEVDRKHPDRDRAHGRIWRVRHESQKPGKIPNIAKAANKDLLQHLEAEILWEKRSAWTEIVDRNATELAPELIKLAKDTKKNTATRIHALWSLEGLGYYDLELLKSMTADKDPDIQREALRSLETYKPSINDVVALTKPLIDDSHYMVKEQAIRTLGAVGSANDETIAMLISNAVPGSVPNKENIHRFGESYEENFQRFLSLSALEKYPTQLQQFLDSPAAKSLPKKNINEATKVLPEGARGEKLVESLLNGSVEFDASVLAALAPSMNDPKLLESLKEKLMTKEFVELALVAQPDLLSSQLHKALEPILKKLIQSNDVSDRQLAIRAIISYHHPRLNQEVVELVKKKAPKDISSQDFEVLSIDPRQNIQFFRSIIANAASSQAVKINAALSLCLAGQELGSAELNKLYAGANEAGKKSMLSTIASYEQGMFFILDLMHEKKLASETFSESDKQKFVEAHSSHPQSAVLVAELEKLKKAFNSEADAKIEKYAEAIKTLKGNAVAGKAAFGTCLACHQAGTEGKDLAPALDGSKNRDIHHMLTAIVKPNDAIEGGYREFRITKRNGRVQQGYMFNQNTNGTTIALMGGSTQYVPIEQISKQRYIDGKSFMISAFGDFPEQNMVDLITYLKTL